MTKYLYNINIHMSHAFVFAAALEKPQPNEQPRTDPSLTTAFPLVWTDYTKSSIPSPPLTSSQ